MMQQQPDRFERLRKHVNSRVTLIFADGQAIDARLLGVDISRDQDLTYEVLRILEKGTAGSPAIIEGATYVAKLADLVRWEVGGS